MAYSKDFREKVLEIMKTESLTLLGTAKRFQIDWKTVKLWTQSIERKVHSNRYRKLCLEALKADVEEYPDGYQYERAARLGVRQNTIFNGLKKLGISYKKNTFASESGRGKTYIIPRED
jgi:transposase